MTILSVLESSFGIGLTCSPVVGGVLYSFKGFHFPFVIVGSMLVICSVMFAFIPRNKCSNHEDEDGRSTTSESHEDGRDPDKPTVDTTYRKLVGLPTITIPFIITMLSQMSISWYLTQRRHMVIQNYSSVFFDFTPKNDFEFTWIINCVCVRFLCDF